MSEVNEHLVYLVFVLLMVANDSNTKTNKHEYYTECGGLINDTKGVIQTPGFPKRFPVPIQCRWVIDASSDPQKTIVIYFTQLYVNTGLEFWDYMYEYGTNIKYGANLGHSVTPKNVTSTPWIRSFSPYLSIEFTLDRLEGNHLRFLDDKHNVYFTYGFNITFELIEREEKVRESCSARLCSFVGNCYASADYTSYRCSCFPGFSGPNCSEGPLCEDETCYNGGTCVHTSAVSFGCKCAKGFVGSKCEFPVNLQCDGTACNRTQCPYDGYSPPSCDCQDPEVVPDDRARYECTLLLSKSKQQPMYRGRTYESQLGKQVARFLGHSNVTKIDNFKLLNLTYEKLVFHFFGYRDEYQRIREGVARFAERGHLNVSSANATVKQEPTLLIESVSSSKATIRIGQEYSISCIAQGSVYMTFTWLKDGVAVNEEIATRSVSLHLIELSEGRYQYTLVVEKAHPLDEGIYTCHVSDWNVQQCKGIHLSIATPPEIQLIPMSATVEKGDNLVVICIPLNNRPNHEKFGYTWIKNNHLLKETPGKEVWEDLYLSHYNDVANTGIILEITDIQKSATYTCQVKGNGEPSELSISVEVVNKSVVPLCLAELKYGLYWPATSPGFETVTDCPYHTKGFARRRCLLTDFNTTKWLRPDFTECLSAEVDYIYKNFTRLTLGYEVTNCSLTLSKLYAEMIRKQELLPGESQYILEALSDIQQYLNQSSSTTDLLQSAQSFFDAIDFILSHEYSMTTDKQVKTLQELVVRESAMWGSLHSAPHRINIIKNSIYVELLTVESRKVYKNAFPLKNKSLPSWMTDRVTVYADATSESFGNDSLTMIVVSYKNLSQFLPVRYSSRLGDGSDLEYEINSRVVTVEIGQKRRTIGDIGDSFWVDIELDNIVKDSNPDLWNWTCAVTDVAGCTGTWDLTSCTGKLVSGNVTKCHCKKTGTYAVLLVSGTNMLGSSAKESDHFVVIIGCGSCLVQSILTLFLLLPYWWRHKTCLVFLKMQCCLAISGAMSIFIYSVQYSVPKSMFPCVTTFLEIFLLIGLSSHLSKVLIVYTEIIQLPRVKHIKETVVCIITGAPVLAVLCNLLGYHTTGWILKSWWITKGSMVFNVFIACAMVLLVLFVFLYVIVMRKLYLLTQINSDKSKAIFCRLGLLKRSGLIFLAMALMESASIFYINVLDVSSQFFFSGTSVLLGLVILFCYVVKSESPYHAKMWKNLKMESTTPDDDFSSESVINPLNFFTKQDGDAESEAAAPRRTAPMQASREVRKNVGAVDMSDQLLMTDARMPGKDDCGTNTQETYVYNTDGSLEDKVTEDAANKYKSMSSFKYHREPEIPTEEWKYEKTNGALPKPEMGQCYVKEPTSQEIITTRVSVELGVITTHQRNEMTGQEVATPAIVLCSVDVEPCQSRVVEMSEVLTDSICCNGIGNTGSFVLGVTGQEMDAALCGNPEITATDSIEEDATYAQRQEVETKTEKKESVEEDQMENVLDRISHDLDYLLNRKSNRKPATAEKMQKEEEDDAKNKFLCKC
ncbi:UNVERIFIED_CONTAM: hypothetical protein PYX00_005296 [Menopon gallinae]